jgi:hypothetical protein
VSDDSIDIASEREEMDRQNALRTCRKPAGPEATGECLYCSERLPAPMRWCDAECRNEWDYRKKLT